MNRSFSQRLGQILRGIDPSVAFITMILGALIAFEMFNYSTTDHALQDLLGGLQFGGMRWSTILALAFCGIDFAGIARLFTPEQGMDEPKEVWYLFGAWLLAATMNAILTWWGVSMAIASHPVRSTSVVDPNTLTRVVPIFVAVMVWLIRVLIIGTLSVASDRLLNSDRRGYPVNRGRHVTPSIQAPSPAMSTSGMSSRPSLVRAAGIARPAPISESISGRTISEPTYQPLNGGALGARPAVRAAPGDALSGGERRM
jgi:hypothetical protein